MDDFFRTVNYNRIAIRTGRKLRDYTWHRQKASENLEDAMIIILNHLPYQRTDVAPLNYIAFFKLFNKAAQIANEKQKANK